MVFGQPQWYVHGCFISFCFKNQVKPPLKMMNLCHAIYVKVRYWAIVAQGTVLGCWTCWPTYHLYFWVAILGSGCTYLCSPHDLSWYTTPSGLFQGEVTGINSFPYWIVQEAFSINQPPSSKSLACSHDETGGKIYLMYLKKIGSSFGPVCPIKVRAWWNSALICQNIYSISTMVQVAIAVETCHSFKHHYYYYQI